MQATGRMVRLALALALACGAILVGATTSVARIAPAQPGATSTLELTPASAVALVDQPIQYTAVEVDAKGGRTDRTSKTNFRITDAGGDPAPCSQAEAGQVTCEKPGLYQVRGEVDDPRLDSDPAELKVVPEPVPPAIRSADRNPTPPARDVVVIGTTGTCSSTGELRLEEIARSSVAVAGEFTAKLPIPPGTFPGDYHVRLSVPCRGMDDPRLTLVVENRPPTPADDSDSTLPGKQITIDVTKNDKDPDDPDGYGTTVRHARPGPRRGGIEVRGEAIVYTPGKRFDRRGDRFAYAWCDIVGPDDQTACGTAMVTVAREPPRPANDEISTERDVDVLVPVTRNDEFPDNDALHVSQPPKEPGAEAVVDGDHPGNIRYKPARGFTGTDTFQYDYCPVVVTAAARSTCPSATVTVTVVEPRVDPRIVLVDPEASPPNREVLVKGTTGTCDKAARLTMDGAPQAAAPVPVTAGRDGSFEARLQIPPGTFVGSYKLLLHAVCDGEPVVVGHGLRVDNQPPNAEKDRQAVDATPGQAQPIDVLSNDTDPDDPDGYKTRVAVETPPAHGTAEAQGDQTIDYTPGREFVDVGEDRFTYRHCDVVGPNGRPDCDTATVTVTKKPPEAVDDPGIVTVQGEPIAIKVMANDRNAGELDIRKLHVRPDPAPQGEARPQADGTIEYRPGTAFTGEDSFQYDYCPGPNVINAAQDCRPATVTVDVRPPPQITRVAPNPTPPNREVTVTGTTGPCREGTLTLGIPQPGQDDVKVAVTASQGGRFEATLKVPGGTFVGTYTLELRVDCDGRERVARATLEVRNQRPDAVDDTATTDQNTPVTIAVTANDTDPDGDDGYQTSLKAAKPPNGTTEVLSGDRIRYTPNQGFAGVDPFTYTLCETVDANGGEDCDTATVTVTVIGGDPVPVDDPDATTLRDQTVSIPVTANDVRPDPAKLEVRTGPKDGTAVVQEQPRDGHIRYTPPAGFTGTASFTYDYCRSVVDVTARTACRFATVTVKVTEPPPPPTIEAVAPNPTPPNREVEVTGTTGSCSQAGRLVLDLPSPGSDIEVPVTGAFTERLRIPGGTFVGDYPLELQVDCQGKLQADEETLEVANQAPDAVDDLASTPEGTPVTIPVTDNDTDPDGDDGYRTTVEATQPPDGATTVLPDNRVLYTPNARARGEDRFTYTLCDIVDGAGKKDCDTATVTVTVATGPLISSVEPASTPPGKPVEVSGNTGSCNHDGTLALQGTSATTTVTGDQGGAFTASLTVPPGTFPKPYRLELRVDCQGQPQRADAQVTVTNQAPVAADDDAGTTRDQPVTIPVTDNDRDPDDPDGYRTRVLVVKPPDHGIAEPRPDLTVVYTPEPGFVGRDRFTYRLCDDVLNAAEQADCGTAATVTVTVRGAATPPVAPDISSVEPGSTSPGKPVEVAGTTGSCGRVGTLTLSGAAVLNERVTGDQDGRFAVTITVPDGTFPGPYKLALDVDCKGQVQRVEADLVVTNQAPVAADDQVTTTPDTATTIDVTDNDRDPDDPDTYPTIVVVTGQPDQGTAEARPDLSIIYTPGPGFVGTDRFTYSLCDDVLNAAGQADCGTATVTVRVDPIACAPSAGDISSLRVEPGRGPDGTRLRITAAADPRLATCQLRLLLGGTPLAPDVTVEDDGSISADRGVPLGLKPGPNPIRLATLTADTLAETSFEVLGSLPPPRPLLPPWLVRLLLGAGAVAAGFLARAAFGKWGKSAEDQERREDRSVEQPDDLRARPYTRPVEVAVEPVPDNTRTLAVRLEPHPDPGIQTVQTLEEVTP